jgi:MinD superfamily P-loop ATPase
MSDCLVTSRASGPCHVCQAYQRTTHLCEGRIYCEAHCPAHGVDQREWGEFRKTEGEQMDLISGMGKKQEYPG